VAPLLCAGLIGFRALRLAGDGERVVLYGFGASAHVIAQVALAEGRQVYAFLFSATATPGFRRIACGPVAHSGTSVTGPSFLTVSGWLGMPGGTALGGQPVTLLAAPDNELGQFTPAVTTTTQASGSWTARLLADVS
jgi:hypothetical protein